MGDDVQYVVLFHTYAVRLELLNGYGTERLHGMCRGLRLLDGSHNKIFPECRLRRDERKACFLLALSLHGALAPSPPRGSDRSKGSPLLDAGYKN